MGILVLFFDITFYDGNAWSFDRYNILIFSVWVLAATVACSYFFSNRKTVTDFIVTDDGILSNGQLHHWRTMSHYHWLGQSQEERIGILSLFDLVNLYAIASTRIARIRLNNPWYHRYHRRYLNVEVDRQNSQDLERLLQNHGIGRLSRWRIALLGTELLPLIVFFLIPFLLLIILASWQIWIDPGY